MQPRAEDIGIADRSSPTRKHEKHRLKCVFRQMLIAQELAAHTQYNRPVTRHQGSERRLTRQAPRIRGVTLQKLAISQPCNRAAIKQRLELPHQGSGRYR